MVNMSIDCGGIIRALAPGTHQSATLLVLSCEIAQLTTISQGHADTVRVRAVTTEGDFDDALIMPGCEDAADRK